MNLLKKIFLVLIIVFLFSSLTKNFFDYLKNIKFYQSYKEDYDKENKKNISLKTEVLKQSDFNQVEKTIRDKLNLLRPGEEAIILPNPTPTPTIVVRSPPPNWQQWWNIFLQR